jgi:peptidoglycan/LPS O-acetylase OafA/YrhL
MFRGVLMGGTRDRLPAIQVILLNGLVFGAFHVPAATVFRFLPSAALGMLLAWVVFRTRSIWPGMLMHFLNNGSIVVLSASPWILERFSDPNRGPPLWLALPAVASLVVGGLLLENRREIDAREEGSAARTVS